MPEDARRPCDRRCIDDSSFEWTPINPANDPPCSPSHELTCNPPYYKPRQTTPCHVSRDTPCEPPPISPGDIPSISPLYTPSIPLRKSPLKSSCFPQKQPYTEPTHLAQKHAPWNDLHQRYTLSSSRHEVYHYDPQVCHPTSPSPHPYLALTSPPPYPYLTPTCSHLTPISPPPHPHLTLHLTPTSPPPYPAIALSNTSCNIYEYKISSSYREQPNTT